MRVIFFGTPEMALPTLRALAADPQLRPLAVFTQPPARRSRGGGAEGSPVALEARRLGLETHEVESVNEGQALARLTQLAPDVIVVVAFGQMLKKAVLGLPRFGCVNLHPSMLPLYRGAAPVQRAMLDGVADSGITIMRLVRKMDAGPILKQVAFPLDPRDDAGRALEKAGLAGAALMVDVLRHLHEIQPRPQDDARATYAPPLTKDDGRLDFTQDSTRNWCRVRATQPWPRSWCFLGARRLIVHRAAMAEGSGPPGTVLKVDRSGVLVACARGALLLQTLQLEGKPAKDAFDAANGLRLKAGDLFVSGAPLAPGA